MAFMLVCVLVFTISVCKAQPAAAPAIYVFGDSFMDVGNNNYLLLSVVKANFPHNGIDFPNSKPTGRFSNGKNIADFLVKEIGLPTPPPYLSLVGGATPPITGVSFASGGGGILNESGRIIAIQALSLGQQVDYFTMVRDRLVRQLGPSGAQAHLSVGINLDRVGYGSTYGSRVMVMDLNVLLILDWLGFGRFIRTCTLVNYMHVCIVGPEPTLSKSLFPIVIGTNDLFAYFTVGSLVAKLYTPQQYVDRMLSTFKGLFKTLYGLGAQKLVVTGVPAIGCCPIQRRTNRTGECNVELNNMAIKYNDGLKMILQGLKSELPGMNSAYFDYYGAWVSLFQNETYGFTEIKEACCGLGNLNADVLCIPIARFCPNRKNYFFWDRVHTTEAAASFFSEMLYSGSQQFMVPMNVEQLLAG
ncbi:putative triacylglycerol lipase [Helianthus annuus]|nr:putative triacylglycerol lipase [Helianthus annuus]